MGDEPLKLAARERIPLYVPEWTDYNESDPGIALLQLFAWLTESMLYQMNRVPERMYLKFLQLLNMELRPAEPATVHLTLTPAAGATEITALPPRTLAEFVDYAKARPGALNYATGGAGSSNHARRCGIYAWLRPVLRTSRAPTSRCNRLSVTRSAKSSSTQKRCR